MIIRLAVVISMLAVTVRASQSGRPDEFTPVVISALTPTTHSVNGTDAKQHVVYELLLTNANATPATLRKIEVVDGHNPSSVIATYDGHELLSRLRTTAHGSVDNTKIEYNGTRLFLIDLAFDSEAVVPERLEHRVSILGGASPSLTPTTPVPLSYLVAPLPVERTTLEIGPPLAGKGWVAVNGCCGPDGIHRTGSVTVNGKIYFAQRFAIDWMLLDGAGRLVDGDPSDVHNYPDYGADVMAVANGTVVDTLDTLDNQVPGRLPDPRTVNLHNVDGNHIVLDLGNGFFAFYAHLQKHSILVKRGQHVKRGQILAKLGNTGNTSGPHLHFHIMDSPSVLGSNGLPYVIDSFAFDGQVSAAKFAAAPGVEGEWGEGRLRTSSPRERQFPLNLNIIDFPDRKAPAQ
ncbi:MAG: M23 family metallopeptidase [Acidobacteriaceae bacterium]|nr:M23 family metallopeptidase [Acidobacteriaceae bacterium]